MKVVLQMLEDEKSKIVKARAEMKRLNKIESRCRNMDTDGLILWAECCKNDSERLLQERDIYLHEVSRRLAKREPQA